MFPLNCPSSPGAETTLFGFSVAKFLLDFLGVAYPGTQESVSLAC